MLKQKLEARAIAARERLAALPLQTRRPRMTPRGIARMADRFGVYSPGEIQAADSRAMAYDAVWGMCGDSTIAGFVDMERCR
jgi:hypothetical protein